VSGPVRITLGGNATVLLEWGDARVVTDPWLSDRVGPWRRLRPARLSLARVRRATLVLISHAHPDHLDPATLARVPPGTPVISPHGGPLQRLRSIGLKAVRPLGLWESCEDTGLSVTAVPALHTRWSLGYVVALGGQRIYFPGDPNPRTPFAEIGRRCGPLDVALLPVGGSSLARGPLQRHLTPEIAARAAAELAAPLAIPIHWGHFRCVPGFLDRFRGTAEGFAGACSRLAPQIRVLVPEEGVPLELRSGRGGS
jgi:L-ascorbate metabolism protein UlaG (beta-lactamase superfamily)